jgi:Zn-dependent M28 family amino/carboxypeptidase
MARSAFPSASHQQPRRFPTRRVAVALLATVVSPLAAQTAETAESDHFSFIRVGVPSLYFYTMTHGGAREGADSLETVNADSADRVARLVFYVGQVIASAEERLRWSLDGCRRFLETMATP